MFAYCLNYPVACVDSEGTFPWLAAIATVAYAVAACVDVIKIATGDVQAKENTDGSVTVVNSKDIITPSAMLMYSFYLNHFSEYSDNIKGTTYGLYYEWAVHNVAYYGLTAAESVGMNTGRLREQAEDVDVEETIFNDNRHGAAGTIMKVAYSITRPLPAIIDGVVCLLD